MNRPAKITTSLIAAIALAGTAAYLLTQGARPDTPAFTRQAHPGALPHQVTQRQEASVPASFPRFFTPGNTNKPSIASPEYKAYLAGLRRSGCPDKKLQEIVLEDVNFAYADRERTIAGPPLHFVFWKRQSVRELPEENARQRAALIREKRALIKDLLGIEINESHTMKWGWPKDDRLEFLPPEKLRELSALGKAFESKLANLMGTRTKATLEDMAQFAQLEQQRQAEFAKLLPPDLLERYELATAHAASHMRATLGDFDMTEAEFRAVFNLRQQHDAKHGPSYMSDSNETLPQRMELERQIKQILGAERYTSYYREQHWAVTSLQLVANDFGIPKETAINVFDLKLPAQERSVKIRSDPNLSPDQRRAALRRLQEETVQKIAKIIGEEPAQAYFRKGSWLRLLAEE